MGDGEFLLFDCRDSSNLLYKTGWRSARRKTSFEVDDVSFADLEYGYLMSGAS